MTISLISGDESYLIKKKVTDLKATLLNNNVSSLNYLYFAETNVKDFIENTQSLPLGLGNRLLVFNNCNWFTKAKSKENTKMSDLALKEIEFILKNQSAYLQIILVSYYKLDNGLKLTKLFKEHCQIYEYESIKYYRDSFNPKLLEFCQNEARLAHCSIDDKAINYLLDMTNGNMWLIHQEINKLATNLLPNKHISLAYLKSEIDFQSDIFALAENFLAKQTLTVFTILHNLQANTPILQIIAFFQTMTSKWIKLKVLEEYYNSKLPMRPGIIKRELPLKDLSTKIAKDLESNPFVIEKDLKRLIQVKLEFLINCQEKLIIYENKIKSGQLLDKQAIELFFLECAK